MKKFVIGLAIIGGLGGAISGAYAENYPADNSGKNVRDRDSAAVTAESQSNSKADVTITQKIRRAVTSDKALSTNAHNIKIVTVNGLVTLRGPVKSAEEKKSIEAKAKSVAGATHVENDLEIASQ